jgi:hypothetical protein
MAMQFWRTGQNKPLRQPTNKKAGQIDRPFYLFGAPQVMKLRTPSLSIFSYKIQLVIAETYFPNRSREALELNSTAKWNWPPSQAANGSGDDTYRLPSLQARGAN